MTKSFIYILSLDGEALYVGITKNLNKRIEQHQTGKGSEFTKLFTYGKIEKVYDIELDSEEYDDDSVKFLETQKDELKHLSNLLKKSTEILLVMVSERNFRLV